jgi:hypothetical protein
MHRLLSRGQRSHHVRFQISHPLLQRSRAFVQNGAVVDERVQLQTEHIAAVQLLGFSHMTHFVSGRHGESGTFCQMQQKAE